MPRLHEQVALLLDTDGFKERMRAEGLGEANLDRWHELKVLVVSRLLTAQYALVLTVLAIRVRLNIVSRHYLLEMQAAAGGERRQDGPLSNLTKRRFLSTEHLLAEGLVPLQRAVTACVREHLAEETAAAMTKERLLMTAVTGEEAVATLAPIRAQLERGITAAESAAADSKLAAAKRSAAEETSEVVIPDHL